MPATGYIRTEIFRPLGDKAIMDLAYKEWSSFINKLGPNSEEPSRLVSDVFESDLTGLRYAVISSFIGILAIFQVDGPDTLKRLDMWPG